MKRGLCLVAVVMLACNEAPAKTETTAKPEAAKMDAPAPANVVRLKRVEIIDRHGFEKPMRAASLLIPSDWVMQDQVQWATKPGALEIVSMTFQARSPDGRYGLDLLPNYSWGWADHPQMQQSMIMTAQSGGTPASPPLQSQDFLTKMAIPNVRRGAKVLGIDKIPNVDEALDKQLGPQRQAAAAVGMPYNVRVEHSRARLQYDDNGKQVEEWLTAAIYNSAYENGMGFGTSFLSNAQYVFAFRAPAGELLGRDKLFQMILSTLAVDPTWQYKVNEANGKIQQINAKGAADRAKIRRDAQEDINRTITEGYDSRQRSQDRAHENFTDYIRGVQRYQDPSSGEQMKLTSGYNHVWSSGNGEYVFTDTANWNPAQTFKGNWTELKAVSNP